MAIPKVVNKYHSKQGWPNSEFIGRPSLAGNPFSHLPNTLAAFKVSSREEAVERYRIYFKDRIAKDPAFRAYIESLAKVEFLVCFCAPKACHGDVIVEFLKSLEEDPT